MRDGPVIGRNTFRSAFSIPSSTSTRPHDLLLYAQHSNVEFVVESVSIIGGLLIFNPQTMHVTQVIEGQHAAVQSLFAIIKADERHSQKLLSAVRDAARRVAARKSKERKANDARRLARENASYRLKIHTTTAVTDNDITDDIAGEGRRAAKRASEERKAYERTLAQRETAAYESMVSRTGARTDNGRRSW